MKTSLISLLFVMIFFSEANSQETHTESGYASNITISIRLCDTTWREYMQILLNGENYPLDSLTGGGVIVLENYPYAHINLMVSAPLNETYWEVLPAYTNLHYDVLTMCIVRSPRNLYVDPGTLESVWEPPQLTALNESFEGSFFPPPGWQNNSAGIGWFRTEDGSSTSWEIPPWNSFYACTNDSLTGNFNNGSVDYLINPGLDLRHKDDYRMTFNSYFDGSNGQKAFIEYCYPDALWIWDTLHHMIPSPYWEELEIDLSGFSGPGTEFVWIAFHSDDQGGDGSGWAVDNVRVFSPDPPTPVLNYQIFLDNQLVGITEDTYFQLPYIPYGEEHTVCVKALYFGGISSGDYFTFISRNLFPPSCFYQADTGTRPMIVCPPLDSNGVVYYNHIGYNLYRDGSFICYLTPETTSFHPYECDYLPEPGEYAYHITALFDLEPYGFPGETGESSPISAIYTYSYGFSLPFTEEWSSGSFDENNWEVNGSNWTISGTEGNPPPSAVFNWDPVQTEYSMILESYPLLGNSMNSGEIYLDFDLKLSVFQPTGNEKMHIMVWNWTSQSWHIVKTLSNSEGDIPWTTEQVDITPYAVGKVFKIAFLAEGENSLNIVSWQIDNINVYRLCMGPNTVNAQGGYPPYFQYINVTWPEISYDQWIQWDKNTNYNSIGTGGSHVFDVAARWIPSQLIEFQGSKLTTVAFFPNEIQSDYHVRVWTGENAVNLIVDQHVPDPVIGQWNIIDLETPLPIDITQELWVGYLVNPTTGYPAGVDNGPAIDGFGNMMNFGGWQTLLQINPELNFNWNIKAFLQHDNAPDIKYALYRSDEDNPYFLRAIVDQNMFIDDSICMVWFHGYKVKALHILDNDTCESGFSWEDFELCMGLYEKAMDFLHVYPNPSGDLFHIIAPETILSLRLYNCAGRSVYLHEVKAKSHILEVQDYPAGVYLLRLETENSKISRKVVIMR